MITLRRIGLVLLAAVGCSGEREPGNDTASLDESPPDSVVRAGRPSTWDRNAGTVFAVRASSGTAWIVNPDFGSAQALDTLVTWSVEGMPLSLIDGANVVGSGRITGLHFDSTCAGWPTAALVQDTADRPWRVAFPEGRVIGIAFDSLPTLSSSDSAARVRDGALAASRLPDDTAAAFRGRPFNVRQANRFLLGPDTIVTIYEVVRLVAQEANPLHEQLLIIAEQDTDPSTATYFHERASGPEESTPSIEILAVLRLQATGRPAVLIRRERENGFILEWIERSPSRGWRVRWRSATDAC
jgi:hypothetical protein